MNRLSLLPLLAIAVLGCSDIALDTPTDAAPAITPQIVYVTPSPSQAPTPTPDDMPTSRPATPEPTPTPTPRITRPPTPEPTPVPTYAALGYLEFLIEYEAFRADVLAAAASMEAGDIGAGVRQAERSTADALAWLRSNPSEPCYVVSYDLFKEAVAVLDYAFAQMSDAWDIFDAEGIEASSVTMEEGMALFRESGSNPDSC